MSAVFNDSIDLQLAKVLDKRQTDESTGLPYVSVFDANSKIPSTTRAVGLEIAIDDGFGQKKYRYDGGILDTDLVEMTGGSGGGISFGTDGQVPIVNTLGDDFTYTDDFKRDTLNDSFTIGTAGVGSATNKLVVGGNIGVNNSIRYLNDESTRIRFDTNLMQFLTNNIESLRVRSDFVRVNPFGASLVDVNFEHFDATGDSLIHSDAGLKSVGIGTETPNYKLDVAGDIRTGGESGSNTYRNTFSNESVFLSGGSKLSIRTKQSSVIDEGTLIDVDGRSLEVGSYDNSRFYVSTYYHHVNNNGTQDYIAWKTDQVERMRMDANGNLGIGQIDPTWKLEVAAKNLPDSNLLSSSPGGIGIKSPSTSSLAALDFGFYSSGNPTRDTIPQGRIAAEFTGSGTKFHFIGSKNYNAGLTATHVTIDQDGNLGVGTKAPDAKLHLVGSENIVQTIIQANSTQTTDLLQIKDAIGINRVKVNDEYYFGIGPFNPQREIDVSDTKTNGIIDIRVRNLGTGANDRARMSVVTNGATSGDPLYNLSIEGVKVYYMGLDNSDDDKFKMGEGSFGASPDITIDSGNVGVGTDTPISKLQVIGDVYAGESVSTSGAKFSASSEASEYGFRMMDSAGSSTLGGLLNVSNNAGIMILANGDGTTSRISGRTGNDSYILNTKFGLGTTSPSSRLHVSDTNDNIAFFEKLSGAISQIVVGRFQTTSNSLVIGHSFVGGAGGDYGYIGLRDNEETIVFDREDLNNGRVAINANNPQSTLDVNGSFGYSQLRLRTSYTPAGTLDANGNTGDIARDNDSIHWKNNLGERKTLTSLQGDGISYITITVADFLTGYNSGTLEDAYYNISDYATKFQKSSNSSVFLTGATESIIVPYIGGEVFRGKSITYAGDDILYDPSIQDAGDGLSESVESEIVDGSVDTNDGDGTITSVSGNVINIQTDGSDLVSLQQNFFFYVEDNDTGDFREVDGTLQDLIDNGDVAFSQVSAPNFTVTILKLSYDNGDVLNLDSGEYFVEGEYGFAGTPLNGLIVHRKNEEKRFNCDFDYQVITKTRFSSTDERSQTRDILPGNFNFSVTVNTGFNSYTSTITGSATETEYRLFDPNNSEDVTILTGQQYGPNLVSLGGSMRNVHINKSVSGTAQSMYNIDGRGQNFYVYDSANNVVIKEGSNTSNVYIADDLRDANILGKLSSVRINDSLDDFGLAMGSQLFRFMVMGTSTHSKNYFTGNWSDIYVGIDMDNNNLVASEGVDNYEFQSRLITNNFTRNNFSANVLFTGDFGENTGNCDRIQTSQFNQFVQNDCAGVLFSSNTTFTGSFANCSLGKSGIQNLTGSGRYLQCTFLCPVFSGNFIGTNIVYQRSSFIGNIQSCQFNVNASQNSIVGSHFGILYNASVQNCTFPAARNALDIQNSCSDVVFAKGKGDLTTRTTTANIQSVSIDAFDSTTTQRGFIDRNGNTPTVTYVIS